MVRHVTRAGTIRLRHKRIFLAVALSDLYIGLEEIGDGLWAIHFNQVLLATVDERGMIARVTLTPKCYPSSRSILLPINPVASSHPTLRQPPRDCHH